MIALFVYGVNTRYAVRDGIHTIGADIIQHTIRKKTPYSIK